MSYLSLWQRKGTPIQRMLFDVLTGDAGETLYENTATGNPVTFETAVVKALKSLVVPFESESGISGLIAYRTGINLCGCEWESGSINASTGEDYDDGTQKFRTKGYFAIAGGATYDVVDGSRYKRVYWYDKNKTYISSHTTSSSGKTAPANACFARAVVEADKTPNPAQAYSFNYPSTDTEYHAYSGNAFPVDFGETVNAGSIDIVSGILTVTAPESKTIQLDPVTIQTLIGNNTVWTDTNGTNTVVFLDKTQHPVGFGLGSGFGNGNPEPDDPSDE